MTEPVASPAPHRRRTWLRRAVGLASLGVLAFAIWVAAVPFPREALGREDITSTRIVDRHGRLLREVLTAADARSRWVTLPEIAPSLALATIHAEDRRFEDHPGIDFAAIARSLWIDLSTGEARTGASTITQQTVKLTLQRGEPRTLTTKLMEVVWAWRLELALSKNEILENYLNRVPYGNQLIGIEAASRMYFARPASALSLAQSAFLAGLPSSPSRLNPYRFFERALARQRWLLDLMLEREAIDFDAWRRARTEQIVLEPRRGTLEAPHFALRVERELERLPPTLRPPEVTTTLDLELQRDVAAILDAQRPGAIVRDFQAAAVVLDTATSEVLAWVGSRRFDDAEDLGQNDGVTALRQPGSALKPFVYGALFEQGGAYATVLEDRPREFDTATGVYRPENFDQLFRGPVSVRTALGSSLNIPAITTLAEVGVPTFVTLLRRLGFDSIERSPEHYGLGLALGNAEVRLVELAGAYATLGRLGLALPVRTIRRPSDAPAAPERVLSAETSFVLLDMLADDRARGVGFGLAGPFDLPYRLAAKTGTSSDFRDNWAVAVTPRHTIAVWVGRFDGRPMSASLGRHGAAPLTRQIVQRLYPAAAQRGDVPWFTPPRDLRLAGFCEPQPTNGTSQLCGQDEWTRR